MPIRESLRVGNKKIVEFTVRPGKKYSWQHEPVDEVIVNGHYVLSEGKTRVKIVNPNTIEISNKIPGVPTKTSTLREQEINKFDYIPSSIPWIKRKLEWEPPAVVSN